MNFKSIPLAAYLPLFLLNSSSMAGQAGGRIKTPDEHDAKAASVIGSWKPDLRRTTTSQMSRGDLREAVTMRLRLAADGTYRITGINRPDSGRWKMRGRTVTFENVHGPGAPEPLMVAADGKTLSESATVEGVFVRITYVRAHGEPPRRRRRVRRATKHSTALQLRRPDH